MGKLLSKHFLLSWQIAVQNARLIIDGLVDLEQKKTFVSSLQNALELGCKQILIDEADHSVINYGKIKDITLLSQYATSIDLNSFFASRTKDELEKFYSIEFNEIIEKFSKKINKEMNFLVKDKLKKLQVLRNNETHFFIDDSSYLTFDEFKQMCELMTTFFKYFNSKHLINYGFGTPSEDWDEYLDYFDFNDFTFVDYDTFIKDGNGNKRILDELTEFDPNNTDDGFHYTMKNETDNYGIAYNVYNEETTVDMHFDMNFNEFYRRFTILKEQGYIHIEYDIDEDDIIRDEDGSFISMVHGSTVVTKIT